MIGILLIGLEYYITKSQFVKNFFYFFTKCIKNELTLAVPVDPDYSARMSEKNHNAVSQQKMK